MTSALPRNHPITVSSFCLKASCPVLLAATLLSAGCSATALSDKLEPTWQTTASYDYIMSYSTDYRPPRMRDWSLRPARYKAGTVTHLPFYYEDPFVVEGDGDETYGWTGMDLVAFVYSPCRFIVNTLALPASVVRQPPVLLVGEDRDEPEYPYGWKPVLPHPAGAATQQVQKRQEPQRRQSTQTRPGSEVISAK